MSIVVTKAAAFIQPADDDEEQPHGAFDVILSAETKDRDGARLYRDEWKMPLPEHMVFDTDHGMDVAHTVGSGVPFIDDDGHLRVKGTYSSIPRGQEIRTLVREGHIRTVSVAFMTEKSSQKDAKPVRELLNGAFVAIPSNRESVVLSSKSLAVEAEVKLGARNNNNDRAHIQAAHDHLVMLGASCQGGPEDSSGAEEDAESGKSLEAEVEIKAPDSLRAAGEETTKDSAIDQAVGLISSISTDDLPEEVTRIFTLIQQAQGTVDGAPTLLDVSVPEVDATEESDSEPAVEAASDAEESAAVAARARAFAIQCESLSY